MGLIFGVAGHAPIRTCELCLQPMRILGEHAGTRLFRCEDCALVTTVPTEVSPRVFQRASALAN